MDDFMSAVLGYSFAYMVYTILLVPICTFLLAYAVPANLIEKYFRQPYFHDGDDELFQVFPFRYYLTLWIAQYTASPWFARRRKMYAIRQDSPRSWIVLSWCYFWLVVVPPVVACLLCISSALYFAMG